MAPRRRRRSAGRDAQEEAIGFATAGAAPTHRANKRQRTEQAPTTSLAAVDVDIQTQQASSSSSSSQGATSGSALPAASVSTSRVTRARSTRVVSYCDDSDDGNTLPLDDDDDYLDQLRNESSLAPSPKLSKATARAKPAPKKRASKAKAPAAAKPVAASKGKQKGKQQQQQLDELDDVQPGTSQHVELAYLSDSSASDSTDSDCSGSEYSDSDLDCDGSEYSDSDLDSEQGDELDDALLQFEIESDLASLRAPSSSSIPSPEPAPAPAAAAVAASATAATPVDTADAPFCIADSSKDLTDLLRQVSEQDAETAAVLTQVINTITQRKNVTIANHPLDGKQQVWEEQLSNLCRDHNLTNPSGRFGRDFTALSTSTVGWMSWKPIEQGYSASIMGERSMTADHIRDKLGLGFVSWINAVPHQYPVASEYPLDDEPGILQAYAYMSVQIEKRILLDCTPHLFMVLGKDTKALFEHETPRKYAQLLAQYQTILLPYLHAVYGEAEYTRLSLLNIDRKTVPYKLILVNRPNSYTLPVSALKLSNQEWSSGSLSIGGFAIAARYQNPRGGINLATVANFVHSLEDARDASFERWSFDGYTKRRETLGSSTQETKTTTWWACHEKGRGLDLYLEESPSTCNFIANCLRAARTLPHLRSLLPDLPEAFGISDVEMAGQRIGLSVPEVLESCWTRQRALTRQQRSDGTLDAVHMEQLDIRNAEKRARIARCRDGDFSEPGDAAWWEKEQARATLGQERVVRCRNGDFSEPGDAAWWESYQASNKRWKERVARCRKGDLSQPGDAAWWERAQASQKRGKERRKERVARCRKGDCSQPGDAAWWENYRANRKRHVDQDNKRRRERIARCRQGIFSELGDEAWWQKKQDIKAKFDKCHSGSFADEEEREWYYAYCKEKSISPRGYERYTGPDRNWCCSLESCDRFKKPFKTKEGAAKHIRTHKDESPAVPRWGTDVSYTGEEAFCGDHNCDRYAQPFASLRAAVKHMRNVHQLDQASATSTVRKADDVHSSREALPTGPQDRLGLQCHRMQGLPQGGRS